MSEVLLNQIIQVMKNILVACLLLISVGVFGQNVQKATPQQFANEMKEHPGTLLDVRTDAEIAKGLISGAHYADFYAKDFKEKIKDLPKDKPVYVYCAAGGRSASAAKILAEEGFEQVIDLAGGFTAWKEQGMPITQN